MEDYTIEKIISMLRDKWYVRSNVDWIYPEDFEYILNNPSLYEWLKISLERHIVSLPEKDCKDDVYIYDEETGREIPELHRYIEYDLLINIDRKTIDEVVKMYDPKVENWNIDDEDNY